MKLNPKAIARRLELDFYTTLTSLIGGVQHIQTKAGHQDSVLPQSQLNFELNSSPPVEQSWSIPSIKRSTNFGQLIFTLLIWIILGFSAGFLIGMLNTG
jgi:hypothetical protein